MIDVDKARAETPGCEFVAHFNSAGSSLPPQVVVDTVVRHLLAEARIGGYEAEDEAAGRIEGVYDSIARLISCDRSEVALLESATRAWDMAFYSIPLRKGDRILTSHAEYASNVIAFLHVAKRHGASIEVVPNDEHGQLSTKALADLIDDRVRLIAISHVPTHGGLVNPAEAVGRIARAAGVLYLLDACQSAGQIAVDVSEIGCHFLSATGRKFLRGPRGTGFLYVSRDVLPSLDPPHPDLRSATWTAPWSYSLREDARCFEQWESYVAGKLGLGAAVDYALSWGLGEIETRVTALADLLRTNLSGLHGVSIHDLGERRCGIVTFTKEGLKASEIVRRLRESQIIVNTANVTASQFDFPERHLTSIVRASVHYFNTEEEIEKLCTAVEAISGQG
jgi:cysteine desulfurase / selenocysteine lyase